MLNVYWWIAPKSTLVCLALMRILNDSSRCSRVIHSWRRRRPIPRCASLCHGKRQHEQACDTHDILQCSAHLNNSLGCSSYSHHWSVEQQWILCDQGNSNLSRSKGCKNVEWMGRKKKSRKTPGQHWWIIPCMCSTNWRSFDKFVHNSMTHQRISFCVLAAAWPATFV